MIILKEGTWKEFTYWVQIKKSFLVIIMKYFYFISRNKTYQYVITLPPSHWDYPNGYISVEVSSVHVITISKISSCKNKWFIATADTRRVCKGSKIHLAFTQLYCLLLLAFLSTAWSLSWARSPCSFTHQMVGPLPENKQKDLNCSAEWPQEAFQPLDEVPPLCVCLTRTLALLFGIILNKPALREK